MKRLGTVIRFKPGVTQEQAVAALEQIQEVVDFPKETVRFPEGGGPIKIENMIREPFEIKNALHEYDDEWGQPTWYIP